MVDCDICGEPHKHKYVITLKCNHSFHYECIQKSFLCDRKRKNSCPLCRGKHGLLPLVNGLPRLYSGIHFINKYPVDYVCTPCNSPLQSGKRKGSPCGAKCMIGLQVCKRHHISKIKREEKEELKKQKQQEKADKKKIKVVKLGDALEQVQVEQLIYVTGLSSNITA